MNDQNPPNHGASQQPPPPPPPSQGQQQAQQSQQPVYYAPPPPAQRGGGGGGGGIMKIGGILTLVIFVFIIGLYTGIILITRDPGPSRTVYMDGEGRRNVAIIPISGMIDGYTSRFAHQVVEDILDDDSIYAVVLRIDSPGGAVTASDEILHTINRLREAEDRHLPIVASYGGVAASGGYYVSCHTDRIFAQPTTVTGSIGVIVSTVTIEGLLENVGVTPEIITSSLADEKDLGSFFREWTEEDRNRIRELLDHVQERFIDVIVEGRDNLDDEQVRALATGRVFTANEAHEAGLIDDFGYLRDAIAHAVELGDFRVEDPPAVIYQPRVGIAGLFGLQARDETSSPTPARPDASTIRQWGHELAIPRLKYLWTP